MFHTIAKFSLQIIIEAFHISKESKNPSKASWNFFSYDKNPHINLLSRYYMTGIIFFYVHTKEKVKVDPLRFSVTPYADTFKDGFRQ